MNRVNPLDRIKSLLADYLEDDSHETKDKAEGLCDIADMVEEKLNDLTKNEDDEGWEEADQLTDKHLATQLLIAKIKAAAKVVIQNQNDQVTDAAEEFLIKQWADA